MKTRISNQFTEVYQLSKTLRFELRPQGKTQEYIDERGILIKDEKVSSDYEIIKGMIDKYHKSFIETSLRNVEIDWKELYEKTKIFKSNSALENRKNLESVQSLYRKKITENFEKDKRYKSLFKRDMVSDLLPELGRNIEFSEEEKEAINTFKRFSTYLVGYNDNRRNIYSEKADSTGIAYRIVNVNFPKHLDNIKVFNILKKKAPEYVKEAERELEEFLSGGKLEDVFLVENFNHVLIQSGIDHYNTIIGGYVDEDGKKRKGINEFANLYYQKNKEDAGKRMRMVLLYKQILSDRDSLVEIPEVFEKDEEIKKSIEEYMKSIYVFNFDGEDVDAFEKIKEILDKIEEFDTAKIYLNRRSLTETSNTLYGDWQTINLAIRNYDEQEQNIRKKQKKKDNSGNKNKEYSLAYIRTALDNYLPEEKEETDILDVWSGISDDIDLIRKLHASLGDVWKDIEKEKISLREKPKDIEKLKDLLDILLNFLNKLRILKVDESLERDLAFYNQYNPLIECVEIIIPLYNKIRNYITTKNTKGEKYKLNFANPQLAGGWDQNKEKDCLAIILTRCNKYYLGIMNHKEKIDFSKLKTEKDTEFYEKMVYKLLPGPNKMLPKVFLSKKWKNEHHIPNEILEGYNKGKHKKGNDFDIDFCHMLIDFFKNSIANHPDWKIFEFEFSPTNSYEDISGFYKEVAEQGYKLKFEKISAKQIDNLVDEGKLYLFQIYNKDFAPGAKGTPNMHTLYWKALFMKENLENVVFKLNGEAELFYRERIIKNKSIHKPGEKMINRRDNDNKPIPENVYNELFLHVNGRLKEKLSEEAQNYISRITVKDVKHKIIKDRRFTEPKYLFHVPITINFEKGDQGNINQEVQNYIRDDKDVKIIGIDRGERHLIYMTLIDQKGKILEMRSFNTVTDTDYHEKLNQREKERNAARKSWKSIGKIKDLKEGYLSQVIHEIAKMMVQNNAVVVLENLNYGFKRGRFKVEKQVYQKFEKMLIDKLNYLVFKKSPADKEGGLLKGYQLTNKFTSFERLGSQCGFLFYVPASHTSKIDPDTGFVNLFYLKDLTNVEKKSEFFNKFEDVFFDSDLNAFGFKFNYGRFNTFIKPAKKDWTVYTIGERIIYSKEKKESIKKSPTSDLKKLFENKGMKYKNGESLLSQIMSVEPTRENASFYDTLLYCFSQTLQMRNSNNITGEDYIISPVKNEDGLFFDSRKAGSDMPKDADANGAYHIALKGLYALESIQSGKTKWTIDKNEWIRYAQDKPFNKKDS